MKTKTKQPNPLGACGADNNPRKLYEVEVHRTDYLTSFIRVRAKSEVEAETQAEEIAERQEERAWNSQGRDLYAFGVEEVKEGGRRV